MKYITHVYPLIDRGMSRKDCVDWMRNHGHPLPPRSACIFCPYHDNAEWANVRKDPDEWARVVEFDRSIRNSIAKAPCYLHRSLKPIDEVDLGEAVDDPKGSEAFQNECDGMCGV